VLLTVITLTPLVYYTTGIANLIKEFRVKRASPESVHFSFAEVECP